MSGMKLPYFKGLWDRVDVTITLYGGLGEDGGPVEVGAWSGKANWSEKVKRVQDGQGQWIALSGALHIGGDILPGVQFDNGEVEVDGVVRNIVSYSRPRNPDGSVNHTRIELA